jgi:hypothetical protein
MKLNNPLIHFPPAEFTARLFRSGGISLKGIFLLPVYYIQLIGSLPFSFLQFLIFGSRIRKTELHKDPVFIIGHYRSGTTYLHKLLASDPQFGVLTNYDVLLPNVNLLLGTGMQPVIQGIINFLKIKNPFFHNSLVMLSEAGEEDDYLMNKASVYTAYWGLVYPRRWRQWLNGTELFKDQAYVQGWKKEYIRTLRYATYKNNGKQLVLKSPPNTERISIILEMFPHAKFIYLSRNPFHTYSSIHRMWKDAILKYYSLQRIKDEELDEIIFGHYAHLAEQYEAYKHLIPKGNLIEVTYESLMADPLQVIRDMYSDLNLSGFDTAAVNVGKTISLEKEYQPFTYSLSQANLHKIEARWGKYIREWHEKTRGK